MRQKERTVDPVELEPFDDALVCERFLNGRVGLFFYEGVLNRIGFPPSTVLNFSNVFAVGMTMDPIRAGTSPSAIVCSGDLVDCPFGANDFPLFNPWHGVPPN